MNLNKYIAYHDTVGNCDGHEHLVAHNLNRIYRALDARIGQLLVVGKEDAYDPDKYDEVMRGVWRDWGNTWGNKKEALLDLTDGQIERYVEGVCAQHTVIVCAKNVCAEYALNELAR
ncbi:MAG: hypothetical protein ABIR48_08585 [Gammaproteobacteria bacterium]